MKRIKRRSVAARSAATVVAIMVFAAVGVLPVMAHIGVEPGEVPQGSGSTISFRVGHGCDGSPTTSVSIRIPVGVVSVMPFAKAGWDVAVERGSLPEPVTVGDQQVTEGVVSVTWSGGSLEDGVTDLFAIRATVHQEPDTDVFFPVVQGCTNGEHAWIEIPAPGQDSHDLDEPAPGVSVVAGSGGHGHDDGGGHGDDDANGEAGEATTSSTDAMVWVALALGALGLVAGGAALLKTR